MLNLQHCDGRSAATSQTSRTSESHADGGFFQCTCLRPPVRVDRKTARDGRVRPWFGSELPVCACGQLATTSASIDDITIQAVAELKSRFKSHI